MNERKNILLIGAGPESGAALCRAFEAECQLLQCVDDAGAAEDALRRVHVSAAIVCEPSANGPTSFASAGTSLEWVARARERLIPVLLLTQAEGDWRSRAREADAWACSTASPAEIVARTLALIDRKSGNSPDENGGLPNSLVHMIIHDLRTPLNVIGLTLRAIEQAHPDPDAELREDLGFLRENARQIERLLAQLAEYSRLLESGGDLLIAEFDPRRFLSDFTEDLATRTGSEAMFLELDIAPDCPREVTLDQGMTRLALQQACQNARAAAGDHPVRVRASGGGSSDRLVIEIEVDRPPPSSVRATTLHPERYERLAGTAAERRGLDLAIVARISAVFGGTARLDVTEGKRTAIILDWPARLPVLSTVEA